MAWMAKTLKEIPPLRNPLLIEGLPGIGNVGKLAADFLADDLGARKVMEISSNSFPHSVFVEEDNTIRLPVIEVYHKKLKSRDILIMTGDVQPIDERGCYEFCYDTLAFLETHGVKDILTLAGIGLSEIPKKPKVYITGTSKKAVSNFMVKGVEKKLYGVVGPIVGVSGVLMGLSAQRKMNAACLLSETYGHPMYLGIKGAKETLEVLSKILSVKLRLKKLEKEVRDAESELLNPQEGELAGAFAKKKEREVNYIG